MSEHAGDQFVPTIASAVSEIEELQVECADLSRHIAAMNRERSELYRLVDTTRGERDIARAAVAELDRLLALSNEVLAEVDKGYTEINARLNAALSERDTANAKVFGGMA